MPEYTGLSYIHELECILTELLDLYDSGSICIDKDADHDEITIVEGAINRAMQALHQDIDIEVELENDVEEEQCP